MCALVRRTFTPNFGFCLSGSSFALAWIVVYRYNKHQKNKSLRMSGKKTPCYSCACKPYCPTPRPYMSTFATPQTRTASALIAWMRGSAGRSTC